MTTVNDIIEILNSTAPPELAEEWDNPGLQIGRKDRIVKNILIALDPALNVVQTACEKNVDMLITHHPLIFKPIKTIDLNSYQGKVIETAIQNSLSIFTMHTNFDKAKNGVGDIFASVIGLKKLEPMLPEKDFIYKLAVFVPVEYEEKFLKKLLETNTGQIGNYSRCSFRNTGRGTFEPGPAATPYSGTIGSTSNVKELKIETVVQKENLYETIEYLKKIHPYETMAYDVYPLVKNKDKEGLGRIGEFDTPITLEELAFDLQKKLNAKCVRFAGDKNMPVKRAAVCPGSGSSLLKDFFSSQADVYISGDLGYHDARSIEEANRGLIDIGHFASEYPVVHALTEKLKNIFTEKNIKVKLNSYKLEKNPFNECHENTN